MSGKIKSSKSHDSHSGKHSSSRPYLPPRRPSASVSSSSRPHLSRRPSSHSSGASRNPSARPSGPSEASDARGTGPERQPKEKEKPNFGLSGKLAEDTNLFKGFVIKYNEPPEARKPKKKWRLYPFKGDVTLPMLYVHRQSAYLIGRNRHIADIPIDHPSCSQQHAVLQFRRVGTRVSPYIIDLGSSNGTFVNNQKIDPQRYVELFAKDVLKFGFSTREYVLLHDQVGAGDEEAAAEDVKDEDVKEEKDVKKEKSEG